jgi:hypothetical protein
VNASATRGHQPPCTGGAGLWGRVAHSTSAAKSTRWTDPARTLEIGNVLSNFFPVRHLVVDKYERVPGVINEDVVDFSPPGKYDLIVSISTLEHVGWDPPEPRDPLKLLRAVDNLRSHLTDDGELFVTLPRGWNAELDRFISEGGIPFVERLCLKRPRRKTGGRWRTASISRVLPTANRSNMPTASPWGVSVRRNPLDNPGHRGPSKSYPPPRPGRHPSVNDLSPNVESST